MSEPQLDGTQIHAGPQASRGKGRAELVKPEVLFVEFRAVSNGFQLVQEVELRIAAGGREDRRAGSASLRFTCP